MASDETFNGTLDSAGIHRRMISLVGYEGTLDVYISEP